MKPRLLIVLLLASLIGAFGAGATNYIPINSVEKLTESQQKTLKYTQKLLNELDNKISLPIEIYAILGDTNKRVAPKASPLWKKAYFKKDANWKTHLVVPLKAITPIGVMHSQLYIRSNAANKYYRIVVTSLPTSKHLSKDPSVKRNDNENFSGISINSNVYGVFLRAFYYQDGEIFGQIEGVIGNFGVFDGGYSFYSKEIPNIKPHQSKINKHNLYENLYRLGFPNDILNYRKR